MKFVSNFILNSILENFFCLLMFCQTLNFLFINCYNYDLNKNVIKLNEKYGFNIFLTIRFFYKYRTKSVCSSKT